MYIPDFSMGSQGEDFKFIIVVPSPAIKEGTRHFIQSDYAKQHFSQHYSNVRIDLNVINAGDFKVKSGRKKLSSSTDKFYRRLKAQ